MEEMTRGGDIVDEVPGEETSDRNGTITSDADGGGGGGSIVGPGLMSSPLLSGRLLRGLVR